MPRSATSTSRETLDDATIATLRAGLLEHKVLFFREQAITSEQHLDFGRHFGDLEVHPVTPKDQEHREILVIQHDEGNRGSQNTWHSDVTWRPEPSLGSILRARSFPTSAATRCSPTCTVRTKGCPTRSSTGSTDCSAIHDFTRVFGRRFDPEVREQMQRKHPSVEHPVVRTHPETGAKGIYVNAAFTVCIKGMDDEESTGSCSCSTARPGSPSTNAGCGGGTTRSRSGTTVPRSTTPSPTTGPRCASWSASRSPATAPTDERPILVSRRFRTAE